MCWQLARHQNSFLGWSQKAAILSWNCLQIPAPEKLKGLSVIIDTGTPGHGCQCWGAAWISRGKRSFRVSVHIQPCLQLSCFWIPPWTWSKSSFSPTVKDFTLSRMFPKVGTTKGKSRTLPSLPKATSKEQNDLYFRRMCFCSKTVPSFFLNDPFSNN